MSNIPLLFWVGHLNAITNACLQRDKALYIAWCCAKGNSMDSLLLSMGASRWTKWGTSSVARYRNSSASSSENDVARNPGTRYTFLSRKNAWCPSYKPPQCQQIPLEGKLTAPDGRTPGGNIVGHPRTHTTYLGGKCFVARSTEALFSQGCFASHGVATFVPIPRHLPPQAVSQNKSGLGAFSGDVTVCSVLHATCCGGWFVLHWR